MARFGAKRPQQVRETLPIALIVCDDSRTAPAYFAEVRTRLKGSCTIKCIPIPKSPEAVVEAACNQKSDLSDGGNGATVWALIDLEMRANSSTLTTSLQDKANECGVTLLLSQPCFEVWILAHFVSTGQMFESCESVLDEVKKNWKGSFKTSFPQKKAQADYNKLMDRVEQAISNSKQHDAGKSQSWTEIWKMLEHMLAFQIS